VTLKTTNRNTVEEINNSDVDFKKDFPVGEGATYTGQMKLVFDAETQDKVHIKHGKGE
jgi:hypothetical protein